MTYLAIASSAALVAAVWGLIAVTMRWGPGSGYGLLGGALALGLGLGASSLGYFLSLIAHGASGGVGWFDCSLLLVGAVAARAAAVRARAAGSGGARARAFAPNISVRDRVLLVAVTVAALAGAAAFVANTIANPHGEWDAWAIWNLRARELVRAGADWRTSVSEQTVHGDYPLLLPGAVARLWVYIGTESTLAPALLAAAYAAALVVLMYAVLTAVRGRTQGLLGALCLLGTPAFLTTAAWQYADIPLGYYLLAALGLLAVHDHEPEPRPIVLAWVGAAAGLAAWTKNEGILFVLCLTVTRGASGIIRRRLGWASAGWFAVGLLPAAAAVAYFKLTLAPPTYEFAGQHGAVLVARLMDPARYAAIARAAVGELVRTGGLLLLALVAYAVLLGRTRDLRARRAAGSAALVLCLVTLGYAGIYLITPADLVWQLSHSLDRLLLQLWPSALLVLFLSTASPAELDAAALSSDRAPRHQIPPRARVVSAPARRARRAR